MEFYLSNVLILGASGMLGRMVSYVFSDISSNKLFITSRKEDNFINNLNGEVISFDIFNDDFEELCNKINPDYVVNCIGAIKPTISDDNKSISNAIKTNSLFPLDITNVSLKKGFTYFQIGTDCVFSGKTGKYDETSFTDADDVLSVGAQNIALNSGTMVDTIGGGNAEVAISAAQGTACGTVTVTA